MVPDGYLVLAGSEVSMTQTHCLAKGWKKLRSDLFDSGLISSAGRKGILKEDVLFTSASGAASTLVGSQCAGPISWKDIDGNTLKDNQKMAQKLD